MKIQFLKAFNGDCVHINYEYMGRELNILIDGGVGKTYSYRNPKRKSQIIYGELFDLINSLKEAKQKIDLLILTHVDDDHIAGILKWIKMDKTFMSVLEEVWFNSGSIIKKKFEKDEKTDYDNELELGDNFECTDTSIKQGVKFEKIIRDNTIWKENLIQSNEEFDFQGLNFLFLSPNSDKLKKLLGKWESEIPESLDTSSTSDYNKSIAIHIDEDTSFKEDDSIHNGSSIAFILTYYDQKMLFLGDSHPSVICESLLNLGYSFKKKVNLKFTKVSHHGSKSNTSVELLNLLECKKFVISTNGDRHAHPHKKCLARIINYQKDCQFFFNYPELIDEIFSKKDRVDFPHFKTLPLIGVNLLKKD